MKEKLDEKQQKFLGLLHKVVMDKIVLGLEEIIGDEDMLNNITDFLITATCGHLQAASVMTNNDPKNILEKYIEYLREVGNKLNSA